MKIKQLKQLRRIILTGIILSDIAAIILLCGGDFKSSLVIFILGISSVISYLMVKKIEQDYFVPTVKNEDDGSWKEMEDGNGY